MVIDDSNSNFDVRRTVRDSQVSSILVIADGVAFGPEIETVLALGRYKRLQLFLPESFEWLVLSSGLFKDKKTQDMLLHPADYIESSEFFSWERFFTKLLIQLTAGGFLAYEKSSLNPAYLEARQRTVLEAALPKLGLERLQPFESRRKELNLAKTWLRLCFVPEVPDRSPTGTSINWVNVTNCRPILNSLELRRKRIAVLPRQEERSALTPVVLQYFALRDAAKTRRNHFRSSAL